LRVTPAGTAVLSFAVDCGVKAGELLLPVVMSGDASDRIAAQARC